LFYIDNITNFLTNTFASHISISECIEDEIIFNTLQGTPDILETIQEEEPEDFQDDEEVGASSLGMDNDTDLEDLLDEETTGESDTERDDVEDVDKEPKSVYGPDNVPLARQLFEQDTDTAQALAQPIAQEKEGIVYVDKDYKFVTLLYYLPNVMYMNNTYIQFRLCRYINQLLYV
jgi:hypothetical protein